MELESTSVDNEEWDFLPPVSPLPEVPPQLTPQSQFHQPQINQQQVQQQQFRSPPDNKPNIPARNQWESLSALPNPVAPITDPTAPDGQSNSHFLGLSLLVTGIGAAVGLAYAGGLGSVAGAMYGGSILNAIHAYRNVIKGTPENDKEAIIDGTYTVLGAGAASYILYKALSTKKNPSKEDHDRNLVGVK